MVKYTVGIITGRVGKKNGPDGLFHDNRVDSIHAADAKNISRSYPGQHIEMELFSRCPFAHFIQYGLGPKQREVFQIHAPDMGQIFHRCIELFAKRLEAENIIWNDLEREQCEQIFDQIVDEVAPGHKDGVLLSTYRYRYLISRMKELETSVWTLTEHMQRGGFKLLKWNSIWNWTTISSMKSLFGWRNGLFGRKDR